MFKIKPVRIGRRMITSTYKNFPISRLKELYNGKKKRPKDRNR